MVRKLENQPKRINMPIKGIIESKSHIKQWESSNKKIMYEKLSRTEGKFLEHETPN